MRRCPETDRVQDFLDGELRPLEANAFRSHLASCVECAAELAMYRRVFAAIESAATWDPGPALTERVLARVLPSRVRRRWMRTLGVGYAAALAATAAGIAAIANLPSARDVIVSLSAAASRGLVQGLVVAINGL